MILHNQKGGIALTTVFGASLLTGMGLLMFNQWTRQMAREQLRVLSLEEGDNASEFAATYGYFRIKKDSQTNSGKFGISFENKLDLSEGTGESSGSGSGAGTTLAMPNVNPGSALKLEFTRHLDPTNSAFRRFDKTRFSYEYFATAKPVTCGSPGLTAGGATTPIRSVCLQEDICHSDQTGAFLGFETFPDGTPMTDLAEITDQFLSSHGISFCSDVDMNGKCDTDGKGNIRGAFIARSGGKGQYPTAFFSKYGHDTPAPAQNLGSFHLTNSPSWQGTAGSIIVTYASPVSKAKGTIIDIDSKETFRIHARDQSGKILNLGAVARSSGKGDTKYRTNVTSGSIEIVEKEKGTGDGIGTEFSFEHAKADIYSISITQFDSNKKGFAFDNFSPLGVCDTESVYVPPSRISEVEHVMFATSQGVTGDLGGLAGADSFCAALAYRVPDLSLIRGWRAVLSTNIQNVRDRIMINGEVGNTNGDLLALDQTEYFSGLIKSGVGFDELGMPTSERAWTASSNAGAFIGTAGADLTACAGWTSSLALNRSVTGNPGRQDGYFNEPPFAFGGSPFAGGPSGVFDSSCDVKRRIYCISQPVDDPEATDPVIDKFTADGKTGTVKIASGSRADLVWKASNVTSCVVTNASNVVETISGSSISGTGKSQRATATAITHKLTCTGATGSVSSSINIKESSSGGGGGCDLIPGTNICYPNIPSFP